MRSYRTCPTTILPTNSLLSELSIFRQKVSLVGVVPVTIGLESAEWTQERKAKDYYVVLFDGAPKLKRSLDPATIQPFALADGYMRVIHLLRYDVFVKW